ncbi:MAG: fused MFS/spermidine synthase, partial [Planctomycetota bacterium]
MRVRSLASPLFLSGAAGLLLEVAWFRRMAQVAGSTSVALAAVLAAVLGGMALGAWVIGRLADRAARPAHLYARLETGVALVALVSPWLLDGSQRFYVALHGSLAGRFLFSVLLLAPPAIFLGGSLPAAAAALESPRGRIG